MASDFDRFFIGLKGAGKRKASFNEELISSFNDDYKEYASVCNAIEKMFIDSIFEINVDDLMMNGGLTFYYAGVVFEVGLQFTDPNMKHKYRADFIFDAFCSYPSDGAHVLVEIDGHEFHEKTAEQAQKDKYRERRFAEAGYSILRFTGTEVFNNPTLCLRETLDVCAKLARSK